MKDYKKVSDLIKKIFFLFFSSLNFLCSESFIADKITPIYIDHELFFLWKSLTNLYNPTIEDYIKIENYLMYGRRPYLDIVFNSLFLNPPIDRVSTWNQRMLQNMNFIGPNFEPPIFCIKSCGNASPKDKSNCIILFATHNSNKNPWDQKNYIEAVLDLLEELDQVGYKGHVLYRLGGYPLLNKGGIKFCHIPYSFKLLSFLEAFDLGYQNVLWLDCSMHPTNDLSSVFSTIQNEGKLLLFNGINLDYDFNFIQPIISLPAITFSGLTVSDLYEIPHVIATIIGISSNYQKSNDLIQEWLNLTSLTIPAMTLYPEEFLLSVASWKTRNIPNGNVWDYFDVISQIPVKPKNSKKPFWFDKS